MTARRGSARGGSAGDHPSSSRTFSDFTFVSEHGRPPDSPSRLSTPASLPSSSHSIRQTTQRAELRFDSVFNRPSITAYITITLREDAYHNSPAWPDSAPSPFIPHPSTVDPRPTSASTPLERPPEPVGLANPPSGPSSMQVKAGAERNAEDPNSSTEEEDPDEKFSCPIVEELPSPTHSN